ncbi:amino acid kinase [Candidatus Micrarchaeota archaeon]|nr:amino acid kinase [Candidatus Micrarchaeota archaeon]
MTSTSLRPYSRPEAPVIATSILIIVRLQSSLYKIYQQTRLFRQLSHNVHLSAFLLLFFIMKIVKLGGSAITYKKGYRRARSGKIRELAKAMASLWKEGERNLVLVHGAGSFGHAVVLRHRINEGVHGDAQRLGFADAHASCSELSLIVVKELIAQGVPAVSIPPAAVLRQDNRRISEFRKEIIFDYLESGFLPVLYGDMVPDSSLGGSVCSGDQIMARLAGKDDVLVFVTNVGGVVDDRGNIIPEISAANFPEVSKHLRTARKDVTGAMKGKVEELLGLDTASYIVKADPERIKAVLKGKKTICTAIRPGE